MKDMCITHILLSAKTEQAKRLYFVFTARLIMSDDNYVEICKNWKIMWSPVNFRGMEDQRLDSVTVECQMARYVNIRMTESESLPWSEIILTN